MLGSPQVWKRTQVLEGVLEVDVADGDDDGVAVLAPVEAALLQPLEVGRVAHLLARQVLCAQRSQSTCMA